MAVSARQIGYRWPYAQISCHRSFPDVQYIAAREHKRSSPLKIGMHDLGSCDDLAAKLLLQVPTQVLDEDWENTFRCWYPDLHGKTEPKAAGGDLPPEFNALRYNAGFEDAN